MKKTTLLAAIIALSALFAIPATVSAQEAETNTNREVKTQVQERVSDRTAEIKAAREARVLERCEAIKEKLTVRAQKVQASAEHHAEIYEKLETRLQKIIDYAESVSYDTTALVAAQTSIADKIDAFTVAAQDYSSALSSAEAVTCEDSAANYGEAIVEARDALRTLRESAKAVHEAFRSEAVPAFTDLAKSQTKTESTETESETETEPEQENN